MPNNSDARTLPPDPSVPGLWWVRRSRQWEVWRWCADGRFWVIGTDYRTPMDVHEYGWRCIAPAVPPEVPSQAAAPIPEAAALHAELEAVRYQIRLAVAALNQAPDLPDGRVTRAQADAMRLANVLAWTFLTDGKDPPSKRRASEAPDVSSDAAWHPTPN